MYSFASRYLVYMLIYITQVYFKKAVENVQSVRPVTYLMSNYSHITN